MIKTHKNRNNMNSILKLDESDIDPDSMLVTDVLVVGSGGGGMTAALTAKDLGNEVLIIEKSSQYGGSTAISGGTIWIPDNSLMKEKGVDDSREKAFAYLQKITQGKVDEKRLWAYINTGHEMVDYLAQYSHVTFRVVEGYSDYYPGVDGSKPEGGRTIEPVPFYAGKLGKLRDQMLMYHAQMVFFGKLMISSLESRDMVGTTVKNRLSIMKMFAAYLFNPLRVFAKVDTQLTLGNALIGRLRLSLSERDVPLHLNTTAKRLVCENGRVTGLMAEKDGRILYIKVNKGVILAAGGFEKNQAMKAAYQTAPVSSDWTLGHWGNQGDAINMGLDIGASVSLMDDAWWTPVALVPGKHLPWYIKGAWWEDAARNEGIDIPWFIIGERSLPGCIIVNMKGRRFTNEAVPYIDFVKHQYASHHKGDNAVPAYMVADRRFLRKYAFGPLLPGMYVKKYLACGHLVSAATIEELAEKCGIDGKGLAEEIEKNNGFAREGKDTDFHKGESSVDRYYSDAASKPNPCLGVIDKPPYYAIKVYPGDLGTKGGLDTDENTRVLKTDGTPIEGLYATGNCAASVMGNTYAGAGGTIGPAMVFGYIAAHHISENCG